MRKTKRSCVLRGDWEEGAGNETTVRSCRAHGLARSHAEEKARWKRVGTPSLRELHRKSDNAIYGVAWSHKSCYVLCGVAKSSINQTRDLLAGNVRRFREKTGWTQEQAADAVGIAPRHYQKIEAGDVNVTVATLVRLANAFQVTVKDLFAEPGA
ncbi:MAG: helix-turn-helix transcriptional regulator [Candidatus Acidiferrales bacterium]